MPIVAADGSTPVQIAPWQLHELNAQAAPSAPACWAGQTQPECAYQAIQQQANVAGALLIAAMLLAVLAYALRRPASRATVYALRLIDRAAYALGIDSRRIVARWRERRP